MNILERTNPDFTSGSSPTKCCATRHSELLSESKNLVDPSSKGEFYLSSNLILQIARHPELVSGSNTLDAEINSA